MCHPATLICTFILVSLSLFSLVSVLVLLSYYANGDLMSANSRSVTYGPGDVQNVFFSPLFCQQLSPDSATLYSSDYEPSHLYLLNTDPTLTGTANISFEDRVVDFSQHSQRNFHFYSNSLIAFEICANNDTYFGFASFYLIKGQKLYKKWVNAGESSVPQYVEYLQVKKVCSDGKQSFVYTVAEEDQYYLVVANDKHIDGQLSEIVINYDIRRTVYQFNESSVVASCNFSTSPCSVRVPIQHTAAALLIYGAPLDWEDGWENSPISVDCGVRIWLYVLMSAAGVLLIIAGTVCLCISCCCCCSRFISAGDDMDKPLLNQRTANLYDFKSTSSEMSNPTKDDQRRASPSHPHIAFRHTNSPYPPPSFKSSGKFALGAPTYETFNR